MRRVDELLKAGYVHVVDADLKSYPRVKPGGMLHTIPKQRLLALVAGKMSDRRIVALVQSFLEQSVLEDARERYRNRARPPPSR